jgi:hypothetical protein
VRHGFLRGHCPISRLQSRRIKGNLADRHSDGKVCVRVVVFENQAASNWQLAISEIQPRNEAEKGLRPFGDRSVELVFSFVCNKSLTPGWGYVEKSP